MESGMSSIERMELVNIAGLVSDLDEVLRIITQSGCFHIESAVKTAGDAAVSLREENPYSAPLKMLADITGLCGVKYSAADCSDIADMSVDAMSKEISAARAQLIKLKNARKEADEQLSERKQALFQVEHLVGLKVDFDRIFSCEHIKIRFGKLPEDSFNKLDYYMDKPFYFMPFSKDDEYYWGVYFTPTTVYEETDSIFNSLYYERIHIPDFVRGNAEEALAELKKETAELEKTLETTSKEMDAYVQNRLPELNRYFTRLKELHDSFDLRSKAAVVRDKFYIVGFVPQSDAERFEKMFDSVESVSVLRKPSDENDKLRPPIKLKNGKFSEPFGMFVEMYGLPSYNGINPTTLVAITYTLLFGIMFGDLGQGICVAIIGALLWKLKKIKLGAIMTRLGVSSAIFGTLYGSVFGTEDLLDPVYESLGISFLPFKAMKNINTVLYGAIGIGMVMIVITMLINIIVKFKEKNYTEAVFANNGIAGLVFFGAIAGGLVSAIMGHNIMNAPYVIFLLVVPIILMFLREPMGCWIKGKKFKLEGGVGDFIASNFFECFEFLLGYATNTLSFVRVGGFVLSHAGMMAVVLSLADMYKGASPVIMVIGNIFVMCLEGMLSGIQVLRLEFYEIFSRFYDGDGRPFVPVQTNLNENIE